MNQSDEMVAVANAAFRCSNELDALVTSLTNATNVACLIPKETILNLLRPAQEALEARNKAANKVIEVQRNAIP